MEGKGRGKQEDWVSKGGRGRGRGRGGGNRGGGEHSPTVAKPRDIGLRNTLTHSAMRPPELSMTCGEGAEDEEDDEWREGQGRGRQQAGSDML